MIYAAVLGFGTVGSGVVEVIEKNQEHMADHSGVELGVKYILDVRDFPGSPFESRFVKDFAVIEQDPEVKIVVETIGGAKIAYEFTKRALAAGKTVVTSNKELVATHGYELLELAQENGCNYLFEASVGGGIPIIRPISNDLGANVILSITGILNGTTNYILDRMIRAGISFEDALAEAQANGYAERDPSADVDGHDAARKIAILASVAYGRHVYPQFVPARGIREITLDDVANAAKAGCNIKLLGRCFRQEGGKVCAFVEPHLVPDTMLLANVDNVFNAVQVHGDAVGDVMFYGRGAGKEATASAVVSDVIYAAKHLGRTRLMYWEDGGADIMGSVEQVSSRWYVRASGKVDVECDKVLADNAFHTMMRYTRSELEEALKNAGISAEYVLRILD